MKQDLVIAVSEAKSTYNHENMMLCALLHQVVQKIETRLISGRMEFSVGLTYAEAMAIHQAYLKGIIYANKGTYIHFLLMDMYSKIDQQAF